MNGRATTLLPEMEEADHIQRSGGLKIGGSGRLGVTGGARSEKLFKCKAKAILLTSICSVANEQAELGAPSVKRALLWGK